MLSYTKVLRHTPVCFVDYQLWLWLLVKPAHTFPDILGTCVPSMWDTFYISINIKQDKAKPVEFCEKTNKIW